MEEIVVCRICLSTNIKLFNIFSYGLQEAYEGLTQIGLSETDGLPQNVCSVCGTLLLKSYSFKLMCDGSQDRLKYAKWQHKLTMNNIPNLKKPTPFAFSIKHNDTITCNVSEDSEEQLELSVQIIKEEKECSFDDRDDYKVETESSDDEPLPRIIKTRSSVERSIKKPRVPKKPKRALKKIVKKKVGVKKVKEKKVKTQIEPKCTIESDEIPKGEVDVVMLTKDQQLEEVLSRKNSMNYLSSFYKCDLCYKGFISEGTYKNHMVRHDPSSGAHECDVCHIRLQDGRALRGHLAKIHEWNYVCKLCKHISKSKHLAKLHSKWHSGHTFVCKFCGMLFTKKTSHLSHVRIHHPSENVNCEVCGEAFIGEHGLKMHKQKAHRDVKKSEPVSDNRCPNCKVQFQNADALKRHTSNNQDGLCDSNLRSCAKCGETCNSEFELKEHLKQHSKEENKTKKRRMKCEECNLTFSLARSYSLHYQREHLRLKDALPPGRAPVVCEICGKKCTTNTSLRFHQRIHTGERPYQCTECPKTFSVAQRLQIHQRTHSGERPYPCPHCPKAFKGKPNLNRHVRVHTGAKPYACSHCGKSFSQSNSMKVHIRTVHLKLPARSGLDSHELL